MSVIKETRFLVVATHDFSFILKEISTSFARNLEFISSVLLFSSPIILCLFISLRRALLDIMASALQFDFNEKEHDNKWSVVPTKPKTLS